MELLVNIRNKYVNIFKKKIILYEKNNELLDNYYILFFSNLLYHFSFKHLLKIFMINYVYMVEDLIFYEDNKKNKRPLISSIILDVTIKKNDKNINILTKFKRYSLNIPIYILAKLENIDYQDLIIIKLLVFGKNIEKEFIIEDIKFKNICDLL
jgi:hypothetical protein